MSYVLMNVSLNKSMNEFIYRDDWINIQDR